MTIDHDDLFERASRAAAPTAADLARARTGIDRRIAMLGLGGTVTAAAKLTTKSVAPKAIASAWGIKWLWLAALSVPAVGVYAVHDVAPNPSTLQRTTSTPVRRSAGSVEPAPSAPLPSVPLPPVPTPLASLAAPPTPPASAVVAPVSEPSLRRSSSEAIVRAPAVAEAVEVVSSAPAVARPEAPADRSEPVSAAPPAAASSLAEEVAVLRAADLALRHGDSALALRGFEEHARRFPQGALREEAEGGRIVALCGLGREEGQARATRFAQAHPRSLALHRVLAACGPVPR